MSAAVVDKIVIFVAVTATLMGLGVPSWISGLVGAASAFGKFALQMNI